MATPSPRSSGPDKAATPPGSPPGAPGARLLAGNGAAAAGVLRLAGFSEPGESSTDTDTLMPVGLAATPGPPPRSASVLTSPRVPINPSLVQFTRSSSAPAMPKVSAARTDGSSSPLGGSVRKIKKRPRSNTRVMNGKPAPSKGWSLVRTVSKPIMLQRRYAAVQKYQPPPFASFVSKQLHQYLTYVDVEDHEVATGNTKPGAVLFSDASGFTALTERLAKEKDGAEQLSNIINDFFTKLIDIVEVYAGDIVKFSGDALSIVWPVEAHSANGINSPDLATATMRACACSLEVHKQLANYVAIPHKDPKKRVTLSLHMGIGCGQLTAVHVGGVFKRWEYILSGPPMAQIAIAEPLANPGETVISPEAFELVEHEIDATSIAELIRTGKRDAREAGLYGDYLRIDSLRWEAALPDETPMLPVTEAVAKLMQRYIPKAVLPRLENGQDGHLAELRTVSVIFAVINGVELVADAKGNCDSAISTGQQLMLEIQRSIYQHEGSINKLLVDDKGLLVLCALGLPPVPHPDDPIRAVGVAIDLVNNLYDLGIGVSACVGVSTGRAFCGVVGSNRRREYTLMGDIVNLSARLMGQAAKHATKHNLERGYVLVDEATKTFCMQSRSFYTFKHMGPYKMKGKEHKIPAFYPTLDQSKKPAPAKAKKGNTTDTCGRDKEVDQLNTLITSLKERNGGTIVLTGSRGSGKTAVVNLIQKRIGPSHGCVILKKLAKKKEDGHKSASTSLVEEMKRVKNKSKDKAAESQEAAGADDGDITWFSAWQDIYMTLVQDASKDAGLEPRDWVTQTLEAALGRSLQGSDLALLSMLELPWFERIEVPDWKPNKGQHSGLLIGYMEILLCEYAKRHSIIIVLHLQTGTTAVTRVDPESWQMALRICQLNQKRHQDVDANPIILCVVTRPLSHNTRDDVAEIKHIAETGKMYIQLRPLNEFDRLNYAASYLSEVFEVPVGPSAMPPDLLQVLSDRAAGNPKHIKEMIDALKDNLTVTENGRVKIQGDLMQVPVPKKLTGVISQEIEKLGTDNVFLLKHACHFRSFTPFMVYEAMKEDGFTDRSEEELAQALDDLVSLLVLEKCEMSHCVTAYFPRDFGRRPAYQFVSKLMQVEVRNLMTAQAVKKIEKMSLSRATTVLRAVVVLQCHFRGSLDRKRFGEFKDIRSAATKIQGWTRNWLTRTEARRGAMDQRLIGDGSQPHRQPQRVTRRRSSSLSELHYPRTTTGQALSPARDFVALSPTREGVMVSHQIRRNSQRRLPVPKLDLGADEPTSPGGRISRTSISEA